MPAGEHQLRITFLACSICGAVVGVQRDGQEILDNRAPHAEWHEELDAALAGPGNRYQR